MTLLRILRNAGGLAVLGIAAIMLFTAESGSAPALSAGLRSAAAVAADTRLGAYDPAGAFAGATGLSIEHVYLPLVGVDLDSLRQAGSYAAARDRSLQITVEPWSWDGRWNLANEEAIAELVGGDLDRQIVSLCQTIDALPTPVIVRWGHEMEAKTRRYAWTLLPPADYIAGYRHFVTLCRHHAPDAEFMWSPMGEPDLVNYYPGDDVTDVIGLSVFALQQYERELNGADRNVLDIARERYERVLRYRKPIYLAEVGCSGDVDYVQRCIRQLRSLGGQLPELAGIVYFNDVDPAAWPGGYGYPDWRLPPGAFTAED